MAELQLWEARVKGNHLQSSSFSAMALRNRRIPTAIVVKPTQSIVASRLSFQEGIVRNLTTRPRRSLDMSMTRQFLDHNQRPFIPK
jgi:hypothetical protein